MTDSETETLARIERKIDGLIDRLEMTVPPNLKRQYVIKRMAEEKHLTYSELSSDPEFARLFPYPSAFYACVNPLVPLKDWRIKKIEGLKIYYCEGYDIEAFCRKAKWRKFKPNDPKFLEIIVRKIVIPSDSVNILDWLRAEYPDRSDNWKNEVIDNLAVYIKREGYKIDCEGDIFRSRKGQGADG